MSYSIERSVFHRDGLSLSLCTNTDGHGPNFFFQHGLCGDAKQTFSVFPHEIAMCHTLECRGHGQSQIGDVSRLSIQTFSEDLASAINAFSIGPCIVGGISMGAAVALRLAVLYPNIVSALIVVRPAWLFDAGPENMGPNLEVGNLLDRPQSLDEVELFLRSPTGSRLAREAPDNLASLTNFFQRLPRSETGALLRSISADGPGVSEEEAGAVRVPTLVIGHTEDVIHPLTFAEELSSIIPKAKLSKVPPKSIGVDRYQDAIRTSIGQFIESQFHA